MSILSSTNTWSQNKGLKNFSALHFASFFSLFVVLSRLQVDRSSLSIPFYLFSSSVQNLNIWLAKEGNSSFVELTLTDCSAYVNFKAQT